MIRNRKNWAPAAIAVGAIGAAALVAPLTASAAVDLPDKTPAEVLQLVGDSNVDAFSGTIEQTSDLGLPDLSAAASASASSSETDPPETAALELLTGSHTAQVFVNRPDQARIQILDQLAERNIIRNGNEVWIYDSEDNEAVHSTIPPGDQHTEPESIPTPDDLAGIFLEKADASTEVSVGADRMVAGRASYELVFTPRTDETLVGEVSIAVDAETGLPLSVSVTARHDGATAFSTAFTEISYTAPDASLFHFAPPAGASVTDINRSDVQKRDVHDQSGSQTSHEAKPTVTGSGWDAVVVVPSRSGEVPAMLEQLSAPVDGGRLLQTTLVNVLLTDDGRILAGSVSLERLQAVAAGQ